MEKKLFFFVTILVIIGQITCLELKNGAYEEFVIKVSEDVPVEECKSILENLETTLTSASQYLFSALDSRAYIRSATVLLPPAWPDSCVKATEGVSAGDGESSDLTVLEQDPGRGRIFTQQSLGCGQPGDQIYVNYASLQEHDATLARSLVKNFAMYRYGVFEEQGYFNDPIYPICYYSDASSEAKVSGCSDLPIHDNGICKAVGTGDSIYNSTQMVDERARSSIMFAAEAPHISMFCDDGNHDRFAPTKHNSICQRRSIFNVIMSHADFANNDVTPSTSTLITNTTPRITYKRQNLTRYVFVIENTKDMMQRESWGYLRRAIRYWTLNILPESTEVAMVLAEDTSKKVLEFVSNSGRDKFHSSIPYTPGDSLQAACIHCGVKDAVEMLSDRTKTHGSAQNVIVVIAAGMNPTEQMARLISDVKKHRIRIATITYPTLLRSQLLNQLAEETSGVAYTVFEQKLNIDTTFLTTYFELNNVLYDITQRFYSGSASNLPIEIHRREIVDDGRASITGSFVLDSSLGQPSQFAFFTYNSETPLIKSLKLISPSHQVFSTRNDRFIDYKRIFLTANISEPGTWTYTVEPYPGSPQPHFLQVTSTPLSSSAPVVRAVFSTHRNEKTSPLILRVEVKRGEMPVLGAKVEVLISKPELNGTSHEISRLELLDSGSGEPDITKGDGVYTRYFSPGQTGPGLYNFQVTVTDNGNTAYSSSESTKSEVSKPCCGSLVPPFGVTPISPFQRILPKKTIMITSEEISSESEVGRVGDLRVQLVPNETKARLTWTSPDMGGREVSHYEIKYANSIQEVSESFETSGTQWQNGEPFALPPGSETTFTLDLGLNKNLLDKQLFFALKAYAKGSRESGGPVSNWVRVLVASPPPPPTVPPTSTANEAAFWPKSDGVETVGPSLAKSVYGLELILPIVIGILLLVVLLVLYCYFCVVKRRGRHDSHKKSSDSINKNEKLSSTITIVPSSTPQNFSQTNYATDLPDPHQVGVPVKYDYEEETKKRYSLVNQQEQQLIEELKQQQQMAHLGTPNQGYVSVISNSSLGRPGGHTLSPYNSWSASQLLHEHERRHSPLENMDEMNAQELLISPNGDHMSLNGQNLENFEHYGNQHVPPPVPPLPAFSSNGYPVNYSIYGVHQNGNHPIYQSMQRQQQQQQQQSEQGAFSPSLQGSLSSVNSGDKKRRNVTMV